MQSILKKLTYFLLFLVLLTGGIGLGGLLYAQRYYDAPARLTSGKTVIIPRGTGLNRIAGMLAQEEVIDHPDLFRFMVWFEGIGRDLKAGEYKFEPGMSPKEIAHLMAEGKVVPHIVTVPEGYSTWQVLQLLKEAEGLDGELPDNVAEGSLLPESYHYVYGDTRANLIERMQLARQKALDELWPERATGLPFHSKREAVILASIVEKETGVPEERPQVASVFINRLRKGMRLQSDPTVIYGINNGKGALGRRLLTKDLENPHLYNTYVHGGLPPGPICNPGIDSIRAVLNPPETDYYYFVADGTGGHAFASTLREHNRNVAKWRRYRREKGF